MAKRVIGIILIAFITLVTALMTNRPSGVTEQSLDTPSPALGKVVATSVHQALTDPYFAPLEKLTAYLDMHPGMSEVTVDLLSKWSPDDEIPTCFVWNTDGSRMQLDHGAGQEVVETVLTKLRDGLTKINPNQLLYLKFFRVNGEKFWLGFIRIPLGSTNPTQMAGAFFSVDRYMERDVPRLLNEMIDRPRFPLVHFQANSNLLQEDASAHLAMRILDDKGEVYFQRGRDFAKEHMIYAESKYFPKPVVALMEGWDLQVFSSNVAEVSQADSAFKKWGIPAIAAFLVSLIWMLGTSNGGKPPKIEPTFTQTGQRPGRIRLDQSDDK